jgi:hypothetical protein
MPGMVKLSAKAFIGCTALSDITLPETLTYIDSEVFSDCTSLTTLNIPLNTDWHEDSFVYSRLVSFTLDANDTKAPCMMRCKNLKSFDFNGHSFTTLPDGMFDGCLALEEIRLPDGLEALDENMFDACRALKKVWLPDSLKEIDDYAFRRCDALQEVHMPQSVEYDHESVFANSPNVKVVHN